MSISPSSFWHTATPYSIQRSHMVFCRKNTYHSTDDVIATHEPCRNTLGFHRGQYLKILKGWLQLTIMSYRCKQRQIIMHVMWSAISKSLKKKSSRKIIHTLMHNQQLSCFGVFCAVNLPGQFADHFDGFLPVQTTHMFTRQLRCLYKAPSNFICEMSWKCTLPILIMIHIFNCQHSEFERYFTDWTVNPGTQHWLQNA